MPQINETPAGSIAGASWKSLDAVSTISNTPEGHDPQVIPHLIALHIGVATLVTWAEEGA